MLASRAMPGPTVPLQFVVLLAVHVISTNFDILAMHIGQYKSAMEVGRMDAGTLHQGDVDLTVI